MRTEDPPTVVRPPLAKAPPGPDRLPELDALIRRHDRPSPRYTSYPTVPFWDRDFGEAGYREALNDLAGRADDPISVYVHLPFCAKRCYYCGCNAMATGRSDVVDAYLDRVEREVWRVVARVGMGRRVTQLHWGGGTPNFLDADQTIRLYGLLATAFSLDPDAEISIEMDPRVGSREQARLLRQLGFTRVSLGVQDLDCGVQSAIGRLQSEEETVDLYEACRAEGFESINLDLVYGLPRQTDVTFTRTIDRVIELGPDRVATFSYAHLPELRANQKAIDASELPDPRSKLGLFLRALERFHDAGYAWVGIDHFARRDDELAEAATERRLQRNFMGYGPDRAPHVLAFGSSAIGYVAHRFVQSPSKLGPYQKGVDAGELPVARGHRMSRDDRFREAVIHHLMCNMELDLDGTVDAFGAPVDEVLPGSVDRLGRYVDEGFLERRPDGRSFAATDVGRFFVRNVAMEFDGYIEEGAGGPAFSRTV